MAVNLESLSDMSDELLLKIASYLTLTDRVSLGKTSSRFSAICSDKEVMRYLCMSNSWKLDTDFITSIFKHNSRDVHHLNLAHCYWLTSQTISKYVIKCVNLIKLDLRCCSVTPKALDKILCATQSLKHLAVTDAGVYLKRQNETIPTEVEEIFVQAVSEKAWKTCQGLTEVVLFIESKCSKGLYVVRLCNKLTSLSLVMAKPFCNMCSCLIRVADASTFFSPHLTQLYCDVCLRARHYKLLNLLLGWNLLPGDDVTLGFEHVIKATPSTPQLKSLSICSEYQLPNHDLLKFNLGGHNNLQCFHISHQGSLLKIDADNWAAILEEFKAVTSLRIPLNKVFEDEPTGAWITPFYAVCSHLRHLNLLGTCCHDSLKAKPSLNMDDLCRGVARNVCKGLVSLTLPVCFILDQSLCLQKIREQKEGKAMNVMYSGPQEFGTRQRVGTSTAMASSSYEGAKSAGHLEEFVSSCPYMENFELVSGRMYDGNFEDFTCDDNAFGKPHTLCRIHQYVDDSHLACISQWKHLTALTLIRLPGVQHGKSLIAITQGCQRLRFLSLAQLGLTGGCVYMQALCEALKYATNLQDLRLEQPNMVVNYALCTALQHCLNLQRLVIIADRTQFIHEGILNVFTHCKELYVFVLITGNTTAACERLTKDLQDRYEKERPALSLCIRNIRNKKDATKKVPWIHFRELVMLRSHVCDKPICWKGLGPV